MGDERLFFKNDSALKINRNDFDKDNKKRHIARYEFALRYVKKGGIVLDCACESGYGSKILSKKAKKVVGIDIDEKSIKFAKKYYGNKNINFIRKDLFKLKFPNNYFDSIVSIETIEHVKNSIPFLKNIKKILKKDGLAIISTPILRYKGGKPYITNPFHLNEMSIKEITKTMNKIFGKNCIYYAQHQTRFYKLKNENKGFCIILANVKR